MSCGRSAAGGDDLRSSSRPGLGRAIAIADSLLLAHAGARLVLRRHGKKRALKPRRPPGPPTPAPASSTAPGPPTQGVGWGMRRPPGYPPRGWAAAELEPERP